MKHFIALLFLFILGSAPAFGQLVPQDPGYNGTLEQRIILYQRGVGVITSYTNMPEFTPGTGFVYTLLCPTAELQAGRDQLVQQLVDSGIQNASVIVIESESRGGTTTIYVMVRFRR